MKFADRLKAGKMADAGVRPSVLTRGGLSFEDSDFDRAISDTPRACCMIAGMAGTGKTSIAAMNAPHPVAIINLDRRGRRPVKLARAKKRIIHYTEIEFPASVVKSSAEEIAKVGKETLGRIMRNFEIAVREAERGNVRTICVDTGTELTEIIKASVRGSFDPVKDDYGRSKDVINREWWRVFNMVRECDAHFILLSRAREIWAKKGAAEKGPTGLFTFRGADVMDDGVDWTGALSHGTHKLTGKLTGKLEVRITKGGTLDQLGEVYTQDDWEDSASGNPFVYLNMMQYPGTSEEDWQ